MNKKLWEQYADWKENYRFVDLTHELSPETPHWAGFPAMDVLRLFDYPVGFRTHEFRLVSQYGKYKQKRSAFTIEHRPFKSYL